MRESIPCRERINGSEGLPSPRPRFHFSPLRKEKGVELGAHWNLKNYEIYPTPPRVSLETQGGGGRLEVGVGGVERVARQFSRQIGEIVIPGPSKPMPRGRRPRGEIKDHYHPPV